MVKRIDPYPSGFKAFCKIYSKVARSTAKQHGFKFTSDTIWRIEGDFVVEGRTMPLIDRMGVSVNCDVKTIQSDNILWDILGFESNKSERMCLRVTGAFAVPGVPLGPPPLGRKEFLFASEDAAEEMAVQVVEHVEKVSSAFLDSIDHDVRRYFELTSTGKPFLDNSHTLLYRCIAYIYLEDYQSAIELADYQLSQKYTIFKFGVGSKSDSELVKEYCERKLAERR